MRIIPLGLLISIIWSIVQDYSNDCLASILTKKRFIHPRSSWSFLGQSISQVDKVKRDEYHICTMNPDLSFFHKFSGFHLLPIYVALRQI